MKNRSGGNQERKQTEKSPANEQGHERSGGEAAGQRNSSRRFSGEGRERLSGEGRERFSGDGPGERGYRGDAAPDVPPGSVPGGSYGAGGGYRQGGFSMGEQESGSEASAGEGSQDFERGEWRGRPPREEGSRTDAPDWSGEFGAYGVRGYEDESQRGPGRSGYGEQGFGAGESRGGRWGGGERGGYGGGEPGGLHGTRGGGWAAAGERYEQGRGPRSYGSEGWGGGGSRTGGRFPPRGPGERHAGSEPPWRQSEFAGRGEFGDGGPPVEPGYSGRSTVPRERMAAADWTVPGPQSGRGPHGYRRSEAAIRDDVCERLTHHGRLDASRIQVQVEQGEVTLEGLVDSRLSKRVAEEVAESVSGVRDVHNRLRIDDSDY